MQRAEAWRAEANVRRRGVGNPSRPPPRPLQRPTNLRVDSPHAKAPAPQSRLRRQLAEGDAIEEMLGEAKASAGKRMETETLEKEVRDAPAAPASPGGGEAAQTAEDFVAVPSSIEPQGRLSLLFELPADGLRLDFLRVGGNPALALDVRSAGSVRTAGGLVWAVACCFAALALLASGLRSRLLLLLQTTSLILFLFALSFLCTSSPALQSASIPLILAAAALFASVRVVRSFR